MLGGLARVLEGSIVDVRRFRCVLAMMMVFVGTLPACSSHMKGHNRSKEAVDTLMTPKSRYVNEVSEQVDQKWNRYRTRKENEAAFGSLEVAFYVNKKGKVEDPHFVEGSRGSPALARFTLEAIRDAKIPPIPANVIPLLQAKDEGRLRIYYKAAIPERTNGVVAKAANKEISPRERYRRAVLAQVEKKWRTYASLYFDRRALGKLEIVFYVDKKGKVEDLRILNDKESTPDLTRFTLEAIRNANIPPMPSAVSPYLSLNDPDRLPILFKAHVH